MIPRKIETVIDFEKWASAVNHGTAPTCDLQDIFARSDNAKLRSMFAQEAKNQRNLLIFSIQKAMRGDAMLDFVRSYARAQAQEERACVTKNGRPFVLFLAPKDFGS